MILGAVKKTTTIKSKITSKEPPILGKLYINNTSEKLAYWVINIFLTILTGSHTI